MNRAKKILLENHPKKHYNSIGFALSGLSHALEHEQNFRLHILLGIVVVITGFVFGISALEWIVLILTIGFVLVCELINTLIENILDLLLPDYSEDVKSIKDLSAGFVLISAIVSVLVGIIIFVPKVFQ